MLLKGCCMKRLCIFSDSENTLISVIKDNLKSVDVVCVANLDEIKMLENIDLIASIHNSCFPKDIIDNYKIINIHPSLLPSFNTNEPVKDAYLFGVKVTGVTVHKVENIDGSGMILAQYPVLIDNYTHFDQLADEINSLEQRLYPIVISSVLDNNVFDIVELLAPDPAHACHSCGGCHKCEG